MGQIPLSFPSVISPLAAADLFQIYSSRTEMQFWSNEHNPVYACRAVKSILYPKACLHPSPSHRTLESDADLPARRCYSYEEQKVCEGCPRDAGSEGRRSVVGASPLPGTATTGTGMLHHASAGPAAPPCGQPGKWECCRPCSLMGALGREGQAAKSRPCSFLPVTRVPCDRYCSLSTAK